jgi:hypothetical protein
VSIGRFRLGASPRKQKLATMSDVPPPTPTPAATASRVTTLAAFEARFKAADPDPTVAGYLGDDQYGVGLMKTAMLGVMGRAMRMPTPTLRGKPVAAKNTTTAFAVWFHGITAELGVINCCDPLNLDLHDNDDYDHVGNPRDIRTLLNVVLGNFDLDQYLIPVLGEFFNCASHALNLTWEIDGDKIDPDDSLDVPEMHRRALYDVNKALLSVFCELSRHPFFIRNKEFFSVGLAPFEIRPGDEEKAAAGKPFAIVRAAEDEARHLETLAARKRRRTGESAQTE